VVTTIPARPSRQASGAGTLSHQLAIATADAAAAGEQRWAGDSFLRGASQASQRSVESPGVLDAFASAVQEPTSAAANQREALLCQAVIGAAYRSAERAGAEIAVEI
jgi:hypothetical protein